jgi:enamine deaminase RidA (YjgF/YER057c/UK114 family)
MPERSTRAANAADRCSWMDLGDATRAVLMLTPASRGPFQAQAEEVLAALKAILAQRHYGMEVTVQTIFLRDAADQAPCEGLLREFFGPSLPVTNFVEQAPCCGAALAVEAWAAGGQGVHIERFGEQACAVSYDKMRWVYCGGVRGADGGRQVHPQSLEALADLDAALGLAGSRFAHVVRTWFYLGDITEPEGAAQRYHELNRARTDFYRDIPFYASGTGPGDTRVYPASTGIGMAGRDLRLSCMAIETDREDVFLLPLENPQQTPAYHYDARYSPQSPKFSRAMALAAGDYVTTWISGTASVVNSETCHPDDAEKQTDQTIDNLERLISAENFARHGLPGAGATLRDVAKIRVYVKRAADYAACRDVCERRFGPVPAVYVTAEVCRPDLLVEIEGVAFSRFSAGMRRKEA